jgi:ABC-type glycerol-3-phosphate transport system substrate-binding protein
MKLHRYIVALLLLSLLSCGTKEKGTVISVWSPLGGTTGSTLKTIAETCVDNSSGIELSFLVASPMAPKLNAAIIGNNAPDIIIIDQCEVAGLAHRNMLAVLDDYIETSSINKEDFYRSAWEDTNYKGTQYAIPISTTSRALLYNKRIFRAAGLNPDTPPRTWKELESVAAQLTVYDQNNKIKRLGFLPLIGSDYLYLYAWQCGAKFLNPAGDRITLTSPEVLRAARWIDKFLDTYGRDTLLRFRDGVGSYDSITNPFLSGKVAMTIDGSWFLALSEKYKPDFEYGVALPPYPEDGTPCTWSVGYALAIPANAQHKQAAWKIIEKFAAHDAQIMLVKGSSQLPARKSAATDKALMENEQYAQFINLLQYTKYRPQTPIAVYFHKKISVDYIERISSQGERSEQVLFDIEKDIQEQLDRTQKKP